MHNFVLIIGILRTKDTMSENWPDTITSITELFKILLKPYAIKKEADANRYASLVEANTKLDVATIENKINDIQLNNHRKIIENSKKYSETNIEDSTISSDWLIYFLEETKNINNDQIQELYSAILAGEFDHPGSFSKRTLKVLNCLESQDAKLFSEILQYAIKVGGKLIIATEDMPLKVSYPSLMSLEESGLIRLNENQFRMEQNTPFPIVYGNMVGIIKDETGKSTYLNSIACLTISGEELYNLGIKHNWFKFDYDFFKNYLKKIKKQNKDVSLHQISHVNSDNKISYDSIDYMLD